MTIRIPKELHKAAKVKAVELDIKLSEVVRELLGLWVADQIELPDHPEAEGDQSEKE